MATTNYKLPTITGNMAADVVRDMNALAEATDGAIKKAVDGVDLSTVTQQIGAVDQRVTTHLAEMAIHKTSEAIRNESTSALRTEVVGSLPTSNLDKGRIVFLDSANEPSFKGYDGGKWV